MTIPIGLTASAVDALRDRIRSWLPVDVLVYDGPDPSRAYAPLAVTVAAAFEDNQDAVLEERVESGARPSVTTTLTVACSVYAGGGDVDINIHREAAGRILTAINDGLTADRTLGGAVDLARMGAASWLQGRDAKGAGAMIGFTVLMMSMS